VRYNPFTDYDKHGALKVPWAFYLSLAFLLRSYVIWIVALSYRQDSAALLNVFYPSKTQFTASLIIALPGLIVAVIASIRRVGMGFVVEVLWHMIRGLMALAALFQLSYLISIGRLSLHNLQHVMVTYPIIIEMLGLVAIIVYCSVNRRFIDASNQFPVAQQD